MNKKNSRWQKIHILEYCGAFRDDCRMVLGEHFRHRTRGHSARTIAIKQYSNINLKKIPRKKGIFCYPQRSLFL